MSRVKVNIPEKKIFSTTLKVRITDINYGNHLGHDSLISMLQEARVQWLSAHNYTELKIEDIGLILADLAIEYKAESHFGDELNIDIYSGEKGSINFDLFYEVKNQDGIIVAKAKTGMICFDYNLKKIVKMPTQLNAILETVL
jgi:acyl-CoA thioester hydrolase